MSTDKYGVQPSARLNERSAGNIMGKICPKKKDKLKVYIHPASIPTKFQTIHYDDNEDKGFNSSATRFSESSNDLPGPGYYKSYQEPEHQMKSKKSVGFASKAHRFKFTAKTVGSPAQYNIKSDTFQSNKSNKLSPAFAPPIIDAPINTDGFTRSHWGLKPMPAPNQYNTQSKPTYSIFGVHDQGATFVFKSKTARCSIKNTNIPSPGSYETVNINTRNVPAAQAAFKSSQRSSELSLPEKSPGPTHYDVNSKPNHLNQPIVKRLVGHICHHPTQMAHDDYTTPGPGKYNLASAADKVLKKYPVAQSTFISSNPRFISNSTKTDIGPGYYKSFDQGPKTFHLNLQTIWL